jgi:hypothetical protein
MNMNMQTDPSLQDGRSRSRLEGTVERGRYASNRDGTEQGS